MGRENLERSRFPLGRWTLTAARGAHQGHGLSYAAQLPRSPWS